MHKLITITVFIFGLCISNYAFAKDSPPEKGQNSRVEKSSSPRTVAGSDTAMTFLFETCGNKPIDYVEAGIRQCIDHKEESGKMTKCVYSFSSDGKSSARCESWTIRPDDSACCKFRMKCCA